MWKFCKIFGWVSINLILLTNCTGEATSYPIEPEYIAPSDIPLALPVSSTSVPILTTLAPDFAVAVRIRTCYTEDVNFLVGNFTQERGTEPSITVPIALTVADKQALYQQIQQIAFDAYPSTFVVDAVESEATYTSSPTDYTFTVRNAGHIKVVYWHDNIVIPTSRTADNLRQLADTIRDTAQRQSTVQSLPPLNIGCA